MEKHRKQKEVLSEFIKVLSLILPLLFPFVIKGQLAEDSLKVLVKSDNLIEIIKPMFPVITKTSEVSSKSSNVWDGVYKDPKRYGVLRNGEVKIYDRFYQLIEKYVYTDSVKILDEYYSKNKLISQYCFFPQDSTYVVTLFYDNGGLRQQQIDTRDKNITTHWFMNGHVESLCERQDDKEKCDLWDKTGLYKNGTIVIYQNGLTISEIEIDKDGNVIKKIK